MEYKLILITDNSKKLCIRYIKKGEKHWNNLFIDETDTNKVIDKLIKSVKK